MLRQTNWVVETINLTRVYGDGDPIYALNNVNLKSLLVSWLL
jgi:hypothetical protein